MILPSETVAPPAPPLDLDLIRKYSFPAPRYTSYPPATKFIADCPELRLEEAIADDNRPGAGPLSLYFHLPFCASLCWYCGCNTIITRSAQAAADYLDGLELELDLTARLIDRTRPVRQVHLGGGTPNFLSPAQLARLGLLIHERFRTEAGCEFGVEIDPRRLSEDQVGALRVIGANRASIGVQDTDSRVQIAIHRWQPQELNERAVGWLRAAGFSSINVDLIYGLPLQTAESFARTIDDVLSLGPERLSLFSYAHVPWMRPAQRVFENRRQLPSADEKLTMFALAHSRLTDAGYVDIGLDHFARPDDDLAIAQRHGTLQRNFQGYSTAAGASLYGFGLSSISSNLDTYRQNFKGLEEWRSALARGRLPIERGLRLGAEDRRRRTLIMRLMCDRRLDYGAVSRELGIDVPRAYAPEIAGLADLEDDGLVARSASGLEILPRGFPLLRVVAMRFDETFSPDAPRRHAQSI